MSTSGGRMYWRESRAVGSSGEQWVEREYSLKGLVRKDEKL